MVTIRLTRRGGKNQPFYHVVVTDKRKRQNGASIEQVGFFNPRATGADTRVRLDLARIEYWQGQGAEVSERVRSLVKGYRQASSSQAGQQGADQGKAPQESLAPGGPAAEKRANA